MNGNGKCPFCGGNMIETRCFGFKESEEVTEEMFEKFESGELESIFFTLICDECGAQSPQFDTEGEAVAFMLGFNERMDIWEAKAIEGHDAGRDASAEDDGLRI